jgi:hypothetical protein
MTSNPSDERAGPQWEFRQAQGEPGDVLPPLAALLGRLRRSSDPLVRGYAQQLAASGHEQNGGGKPSS